MLSANATNRVTCRYEASARYQCFDRSDKPTPEARVLEWLDGLDEDRTLISVISIAEIRRGVALMDAERKRDALIEWLATAPHASKIG